MLVDDEVTFEVFLLPGAPCEQSLRGFIFVWRRLGAGLGVTDRSSSGQQMIEEDGSGRGAGEGDWGGERRSRKLILMGKQRQNHSVNPNRACSDRRLFEKRRNPS